MSSYWKRRAGRVIWPLVQAGQKAGTPAKEILRQIDQAYPFGTREHHPYKMWLEVRKEAIKALGLETKSTQPRLIGPLFGGQA
ncbi:hypothetical protein [Deinococcus multiflagellatus]|uniref:Uncharacterized protein n=1 Tax=Deinococcus multiflagellatus TaxID=1656887 RepID=A0ABW1ZEP7_9DEIO|nr:hypothetical protein [Deinococcus multiflagellatus]MBZ9712215.1 hypothetical protein [Deinococcus multiflagellatus]